MTSEVAKMPHEAKLHCRIGSPGEANAVIKSMGRGFSNNNSVCVCVMRGVKYVSITRGLILDNFQLTDLFVRNNGACAALIVKQSSQQREDELSQPF